MKGLFNKELQVINTGLRAFTEPLEKRGVNYVQVDWRPPAPVAEQYVSLIREKRDVIEAANGNAVARILQSKPLLKGMDTALTVIPGMKKKLILHAGPPVEWKEMCGPMKGGIMAALMYEGLAKGPDEAQELAASGDIDYAPCHEHATVGPMAGIVSASMPVFILENETYGNHAYCTMNEGLGKVLRYGAYSADVIARLKWMERVLYPALKAALESLGSIDLKNIMAQALHMGDEVHNRNRAATSLFFRKIAPALVECTADKEAAAGVMRFIDGNDHFFLNLSMPACKVSLDAGRGVENSSLVTVMSRNGTRFGVQLSGTGDRWFTGPAPLPDALFFPGYSKADANPDIGDSSITETNGLGGFAIAAAPAIVQFVGGSVKDALSYTLQMYEITVAENNVYQIPALNFRGTPTGIDVTRVVETGVLPFIDTGVAHKDPGVGQVGAGVLNAPMEPFKKAYVGLAKNLNNKTNKTIK